MALRHHRRQGDALWLIIPVFGLGARLSKGYLLYNLPGTEGFFQHHKFILEAPCSFMRKNPVEAVLPSHSQREEGSTYFWKNGHMLKKLTELRKLTILEKFWKVNEVFFEKKKNLFETKVKNEKRWKVKKMKKVKEEKKGRKRRKKDEKGGTGSRPTVTRVNFDQTWT